MENTAPHGSKTSKATYAAVFVALLLLTGLTVLASGLKAGVAISASVAFVLASIKGGLVAGFFMHLAGERRSILALAGLTGCFLAMLIGLLVWSLHSGLTGTEPAPIQPAAAVVTSIEEG